MQIKVEKFYFLHSASLVSANFVRNEQTCWKKARFWDLLQSKNYHQNLSARLRIVVLQLLAFSVFRWWLLVEEKCAEFQGGNSPSNAFLRIASTNSRVFREVLWDHSSEIFRSCRLLSTIFWAQCAVDIAKIEGLRLITEPEQFTRTSLAILLHENS